MIINWIKKTFHIHWYKHTDTSVWHEALFYKCRCGKEKYSTYASNWKTYNGGLQDLLNKKYYNENN